MKINPQIKIALASTGIAEADGIAYLLSVYFDCKPSYTPLVLVQRMHITNILGIEGGRTIWNIPLFEEGINEKWEWVKDWNIAFKNINSKRKATDKECITRMKMFFAENPDIRKEDVLGATRLYLSSLTSPEYLISSHYFISKGVGRDRTSALEAWVERYQAANKEIPQDTIASEDISHQMQ